MGECVLIADANAEEGARLLERLSQENYSVIGLGSVTETMAYLGGRKEAPRVLILDLDSLPVDTPQLTAFRKRCPTLSIIVLSSRSFHPELRQAMEDQICACLRKPLDTDELLYFVRSFCEDWQSEVHP